MANPMNATVKRTRILRRIFLSFLRAPDLADGGEATRPWQVCRAAISAHDHSGLAEERVPDVEANGGGCLQVEV